MYFLNLPLIRLTYQSAFQDQKNNSMGRENLSLKDSVANLFYIALHTVFAYHLRQKQTFKLEKSICKVM